MIFFVYFWCCSDTSQLATYKQGAFINQCESIGSKYGTVASAIAETTTSADSRVRIFSETLTSIGTALPAVLSALEAKSNKEASAAAIEAANRNKNKSKTKTPTKAAAPPTSVDNFVDNSISITTRENAAFDKMIEHLEAN